MIANARSEIENHAIFVRPKATVSETRFDHILQWPTDPERHIDVALIGVVTNLRIMVDPLLSSAKLSPATIGRHVCRLMPLGDSLANCL